MAYYGETITFTSLLIGSVVNFLTCWRQGKSLEKWHVMDLIFYFFRSDQEDEDNDEEPHCLKVLYEE